MRDLSCYAEGTAVSLLFAAGKGYLLTAGTNYYFPVETHDQHIAAIELAWDNALAGVATFESTNFAEVDHAEATALAHWCPELDAAATPGFTGNMTWAGLTGTLLTGAVGCTLVHLGNFGAARRRVKFAVGATGGYLRVNDNGKS